MSTQTAIARIAKADLPNGNQSDALLRFANEHPEYTVRAVKEADAGDVWLALLEKKADFGKDMPLAVDEAAPLGGDTAPDAGLPPLPLDDGGLNPDGGEDALLSELKDLMGRVEEIVNKLDHSDGDHDADDSSDSDPVSEPPAVSTDEPVDESKTPDFLPGRNSSIHLEREKEAGLTLTAAVAEVEKDVLSAPEFAGYKIASIRESDDRFFVTLEN